MTAAWTSRPLLCLDTETTGVNPFEDRIVEVASVTLDVDGNVLTSWSAVVDPGIEIPDGAAAVHGITTERARAEGVTPAEAIEHVAEDVFATAGRAPVVMFNARYDWPLLICEAERHGVEFPAIAPILDPYLIDRMVDRYRSGGRKLTLVAGHYGVDLSDEDAHGAAADATAAGRVMRRLLEKHPEIGSHSLADLWVRQVRGHEQDRARFVDYMRRNRNPDFDSAPGWPIPAGASS